MGLLGGLLNGSHTKENERKSYTVHNDTFKGLLSWNMCKHVCIGCLRAQSTYVENLQEVHACDHLGTCADAGHAVR